MEINEKEATGIKFQDNGLEYIKAVKKPSSDLKITQEIWMSGKKEVIEKKLFPKIVLPNGQYLDMTIDNLWDYLEIKEV